MTDILGQQIPGKSQAIFQIDTATLRFVTAQLHLKQVIPVADTCLHGSLGILGYTGQLFFHRLQSMQFFFQHDYLPEIILHRKRYLIFRTAKLETACFYSGFRQFITVYQLSAGKQRQGSRYTSDDSILHHRHLHLG